jgi:RNA ligase (TIGR02306 family)
MSSLILEAGYPTEILDHPNADKMKLAVWKGWQCCVDLEMTTETHVVYFQPDLVLPHALAEDLGVTQYLKGLGKNYPNNQLWAGRVGVARLRSVPSYGILARVRPDWESNLDNLAEYLGVDKYDPPEKVSAGDSERDSAFFSRYTDIENLQNFPDSFVVGEPVIVTEKIHGTNVRLGYCPESDGKDYKWMAGSHGLRRREELPESDKVSLYWQPFKWVPTLKDMIDAIRAHYNVASVVVYGEIFGSGVQDLTYGLKNSEKGFRVFDISINNQYLDAPDLAKWCITFDVPMVNVLYHGPFRWDLMEQMAEGNTTMEGSTNVREGIVIRPEMDCVDAYGRKVRKMIGFGYLNRKGGSENH